MEEKLTETIINLCNLINKKLENDSYTDYQGISEITKATAELVRAKAGVRLF